MSTGHNVIARTSCNNKLLIAAVALTNRLRYSREKSPEKALPLLPSGIVDWNGNTGTFRDNNLISNTSCYVLNSSNIIIII